MKKNKKILLGAISAMALAAISTGAVSTLAWYQSTQNVGVSIANTLGTLTTTKTDLDLDSVTLIVTLAPSESKTVELTDSTGKIGAYVNGSAQTQSSTAGHQIENTIAVGVYVNAANKSVLEDENVVATLKGKTYSIDVAAEGQVRFFSSNAVNTAGVQAAKLRITFDETNAPTFGSESEGKYEITNLDLQKVMINDSGWKEVHYAIRTNNPDGKEYVKSAGQGSSWSDNVIDVASGSEAAVGTKGYDSTSFEVKSHAGSGTWNQLGTRAYLHEADKVTIAAGSFSAE